MSWNLLRDVRFGLRVFSGSRAFAAVAILTLGLGIACTSTVFSWVDGVLLRPFPGATRTNELVSLEMVTPGAPNGGTSISWLDYRDFRDQMKSLSGLAVHRQCAFTLGDGQDSGAPAKLAWGELVSGNYFDVMGVKPAAGRMFTPEENGDKPGAFPVAVISARLWRSEFQSDPRISGKTIRVNQQQLTIVGVAPEEFRGTSPVMSYDLWIPVTMGATLGSLTENSFTRRSYRGMLTVIGRRVPGVSIEQARAEAASLAATLAAMYPESNRAMSATVLPTWEEHNGVNEYLRAPLTILLGVSFLVLLIVCANVANLLLARSVGRQREFGIRFALGAGRLRVAVQVMTETLVLALAGTAVGVLILLWMQGSLLGLAPNIGFPIQTTTLAWDSRILGFTAIVCITATVLSGVFPALFVFRSNLNEVLKEGSRSDTAGAASRRTRGLLVVGEVALATVALVAAGLFVRSFHNLRTIPTGFDSSKVLLGRFFIETTGYKGPQIERFAVRLQQKLLGSPMVEAVSFSDFVPLSGSAGPYNGVTVEGYTPAVGESPAVNRALIAPGYFDTMKIPILEGRDFTDRDDRNNADADPVMVVNESFARRYFDGRNPIGRKVRTNDRWCTIVGLAKDSKYFSPGEAPSPHFYLPFRQFYGSSPELYFLIRTTGATSPAQAIPLLRQAVAEVDATASAVHGVPLSEYTEVVTFGQKVAANLMGALSILCLLLAASGLYSVMSYTVSQRVPEIGIRMAMGAAPSNVLAMVVGQGMTLVGSGIALGVLAALATTRMIASMLYGVGAADAVTFGLAGLFLAFVAFLATSLPALRATKIDPMQALRR